MGQSSRFRVWNLESRSHAPPPGSLAGLPGTWKALQAGLRVLTSRSAEESLSGRATQPGGCRLTHPGWDRASVTTRIQGISTATRVELGRAGPTGEQPQGPPWLGGRGILQTEDGRQTPILQHWKVPSATLGWAGRAQVRTFGW